MVSTDLMISLMKFFSVFSFIASALLYLEILLLNCSHFLMQKYLLNLEHLSVVENTRCFLIKGHLKRIC